MKTKVLKLYDYKSEPLPEELLQWRVSEGEVDAQLALLSRNHAKLTEREAAGRYDAVRCRVTAAAGGWDRPVTLVYPGRGLCKELENACLGIRAGEERTTMMDGVELTFTAERVAGMDPLETGDALIRAEKIDGVETVADYRRWWKESEEASRRYRQGLSCALHLLDVMAKKSEYDLDQREIDDFFTAEAESQRRMMSEGGVPEELMESAEDIKARFLRYPESYFFRPKIITPYVVELLRTGPLEDEMERAADSFAALNHYDPAEVRAQMREHPAYREQILLQAALELLRETYVDGILEVQ